ncbi:MAG: GNAT family N-acetyltransferase [Gammaproteobacteria bacterium]|jgi:ribosomal protein S18 acetylase RimI-like enzyme|nr:GNAT family N-acetyltransferase [Gammaproteobacteria bacterium]
MIVRQAQLSDLDMLAELFDLYRQFYRYPRDLNLARNFLRERIGNEESVIYLAENEQSEGLGFVQLYPSFSSTLAGRVWILYDLFVHPGARRQGVARALMERAERLATATGAVEINLATATDNVEAQALYESLGYQRDRDFYVYALSPGSR